MTPLHSIILGIIQGITEFLPVSSSAHLMWASKLMDLPSQRYAFDVCLNLGSLLALLIFFRKDMEHLLCGFFNCSPDDRKFFLLWFVSSLPVIGIFFIADLFFDLDFKSPILLASALLLFGGILFCCDQGSADKKSLSLKDGIWIGFAQCLALIPGVSRLGAAMSMMRYLNYSRSESFRFSMLLSIGPVSGALFLTLLKIISGKVVIENWNLLLLGCLFSFIFGLLTLRLVTNFLRKHTFLALVIYRIIFGLLVLLCF
ncbi:MAG: undecaprenyl-diphosphate phosphatase [Holosporaceae bacterium]|jgi:undecaprenyl-diphosphatase|nr:undecaprenyl-diphosphate phosphatase [Holosporaceae bacterium]